MNSLVLVVDDDARSVNRLAVMLREDGWQVDTAVDGEAAIARLSREPSPSVLVTDLRMPRADGVSVVRFARERLRDLPIVVLTGYPQLVPRDVAPELVLTKPLAYSDLSAALERLAPERRSNLTP